MSASVIGGVVASTQRYRRSQRLTATGVWTCPAGVFEVEAIIIGGGPGGGGGSPGVYTGGTTGPMTPGMGGNGGGSAYARKVRIPVVPGTSYPVIIGAGGAGGIGAPGQTSSSFPYPGGTAGQPGTPTSFAGYRVPGGVGSPGGIPPSAQTSSNNPNATPITVALIGSPNPLSASMADPQVSSAGGTPLAINPSAVNYSGGPAGHRPGFGTIGLNINISDPNQYAAATAADFDAYAHVGGAASAGVGGAAASPGEATRFGGVGGAAGAAGAGAITTFGATTTIDGGTGASATAPGGGGGGGGGGAARNQLPAPSGRGGDGGAGGAGAVLLFWEE